MTTTEGIGSEAQGAAAGSAVLSPGPAAQRLALKWDEFELAVQMGLVRTLPGTGPRIRVEPGEVDRLRAAPDFPDGLRERVRAVGTAEAAALLSVSAERFTWLARTGHVRPVRFYLNRYNTVVWLYLAGELREFARDHPELLKARMGREARDRRAAGEDRRPRNWRARRLGLLLRATDDPWERAAAIASLLDPVQLAEVVVDPYERSFLLRLRPPLPPGLPEGSSAREIADRLMVADDPDEILWHRTSLAMALEEARELQTAPRPAARTSRLPVPEPAHARMPAPAPPPAAVRASAPPAGPGRSGRARESVRPPTSSRNLLTRLRLRRGSRPGAHPAEAAGRGTEPGPAREAGGAAERERRVRGSGWPEPTAAGSAGEA
ncbi:DUF6397 family protein [Streptomyces tritici]|uniref:DUF6397 family protein n=1 Tax=Streptomyces tritici TaxID=2054410 RepID=UPI003AF1B478